MEEEEPQRPKLVIPRYVKLNHSISQIIEDMYTWIQTRRKVRQRTCLVSYCKPRIVNEAYKNDYWIKVVKEELDQIEKSYIWTSVSRPRKKCDR